MDEDLNLNGNLEIGKALKEFEAESAVNSYKAIKLYNETTVPKIVQLVIKWSGGTIKKEKQAEYILLGFVILALGISFYLFFGGNNKTPQPFIEQLGQMENMMP